MKREKNPQIVRMNPDTTEQSMAPSGRGKEQQHKRDIQNTT